jgi:2-polyprenyl-3-methyl-5-hydroxy-6-metoxy-1,4-benzoquinol methylase
MGPRGAHPAPKFCATKPCSNPLLALLSMRPVDASERITLDACPLCGGRDFVPVTRIGPHPVVRCRACRLQFTNPQPSNAELAAIYGADYVLAADDSEAAGVITRSKRATADHYLDVLDAATSPPGAVRGRLLEIGCGAGNFLLQAWRRGFEVTGVEYSAFACQRARATLGDHGRVLEGEIGVVAHEAGTYDVCIACDVIEHVRAPLAFLGDVRRLLRPGGILLVATPSIDSWSARVLGKRWMEFKAEHLFYYAPDTIARELRAAGFDGIVFRRGVKKLSIEYVVHHFEKYPVTGITRSLRLLRKLLPRSWREHPFSIVASGLLVLAHKPAGPA